MTDTTPRAEHQTRTSKLLRGAIWIAIGALIAAALVCVIWVLIGDQDGIIGRAFLTILLLALFAGVAIAEAHMAERRPDWLALASMVSWIIVLLVGAVKIWMPEHEDYYGWVSARFFQLLLVIIILQLALLHVRLFLRASERYVTTFTRVIVITTFAILAALVAMLVFYLTFPDLLEYHDLYWRVVIALAILAAVGTTLIPLLNALFAPRRPRPAAPAAQQYAPQQQYGDPRHGQQQYGQQQYGQEQPVTAWPTYADGRTPLPVMPDGAPDWNAYYTGHPTYSQGHAVQSFPVVDAPSQPHPDASPQPPATAPAQQPAHPAAAQDPRSTQDQPPMQDPPRAQDQPPAQPPVPPRPPVPPQPPAPGSYPPPPSPEAPR